MTYKYMTKEEFEVFSPLYCIMDYEEYVKDMSKVVDQYDGTR